MWPPSLRERAYTGPQGELAWRRDDLPQVVDAIVKAGRLILGGEAWTVRDGEVHGVIPTGGRRGVVFTWVTDPAPGVAWAERVQRAARQALAAVASLDAEHQVAVGLASTVWWNLTTCSEAEEPAILARAKQGP